MGLLVAKFVKLDDYSDDKVAKPNEWNDEKMCQA
jgi:hypothetical protein